MKRLKLATIFALAAMLVVSCGSKNEEKKRVHKPEKVEKKTEKKEEETPKYQLPSYSFDYALPVTSGNCAAITRCSDVKTFIPKTEEELKCLKQNCDNIGGKWRQEHKLTYVCMC